MFFLTFVQNAIKLHQIIFLAFQLTPLPLFEDTQCVDTHTPTFYTFHTWVKFSGIDCIFPLVCKDHDVDADDDSGKEVAKRERERERC